MSENLAALKVFVRVARTGNFSKAGRDLSLSQPTVSRIIADLETELGARLFTRTTRLVTLTDAGSDYLARIEPIIDALEEANHAVRGTAELRGTLRVGLTTTFGTRAVIPRLPRFAALHPALHVELMMTDARRDLGLEGLDLALRLGPLESSSAIARKITSLRRIVAASPNYLAGNGTPKAPSELARHQIIPGPLGVANGWSFQKDERVVSVKPSKVLSIDMNEGAVAAAVSGLGILATGTCFVMPEITNGSLVELLPDWEMERIDVHAVFLNGRNMKPAARALIDFLATEFRLRPPQQE